mmetsp:Transcript_77755/g.122653  ORF Transcript_77755/g.122653 Transcript_77755/m.122653 type:complete len:95 (+) Transcript_77755:214-498(+)
MLWLVVTATQDELSSKTKRNTSCSGWGSTASVQAVKELEGIKTEGVLKIPLREGKDVVKEVVEGEVATGSVLDPALRHSNDTGTEGVDDQGDPK